MQDRWPGREKKGDLCMTIRQEGEQALLRWEKQFIDRLKARGLSLNTVKNYQTDLSCFKQFLLSEQDHLDMSDFGTPQIKIYGEYLDNRYKSDNSRRRRVQTLRLFFDFLVEEQAFSKNPVREIPTSPKFLDVPRPTPFGDLRVAWNFFNKQVAEETGLAQLIARRNQVIFILIYGSGLKVSDLAKLKAEHIFFNRENRVMVAPNKKDPYTIPLLPGFDDVYLPYREALDKQKLRDKVEFDSPFFNANPYRILSGGLSPRGLELVFEDYRKQLNIQLTPKSLRQACIFRWLHENNPDGLIREWLGVSPSYDLGLYKKHQNLFIYKGDLREN